MSWTSSRLVRKCTMKSRQSNVCQHLEEFIKFIAVAKSWLKSRRSKKKKTNDKEMAETIKCARFYKQELSKTKGLLLQENSLTPQILADIDSLIKGFSTIITQKTPNKTDLHSEPCEELQQLSGSQSFLDVDLGSFELNKLTNESFPITPNERNKMYESDMNIETSNNYPESQLKNNPNLRNDQQDSLATVVTLSPTTFKQTISCNNKNSSSTQVSATNVHDDCNIEMQDTLAFLQTQTHSSQSIQPEKIYHEPSRSLPVHENNTQQTLLEDSGILVENIQSFDLLHTTDINEHDSTKSVDDIQKKLDRIFKKAIDIKQRLDNDDMQTLSSVLEMLSTISNEIVAEIEKPKEPMKITNPFELIVTGFEPGSTDFYPTGNSTEKPNKRKTEEDFNYNKVIRRDCN